MLAAWCILGALPGMVAAHRAIRSSRSNGGRWLPVSGTRSACPTSAFAMISGLVPRWIFYARANVSRTLADKGCNAALLELGRLKLQGARSGLFVLSCHVLNSFIPLHCSRGQEGLGRLEVCHGLVGAGCSQGPRGSCHTAGEGEKVADGLRRTLSRS